MKLVDAVIMGRFCGLETVGECLLHVELHYWQMLPYSAVASESIELHDEVVAWEAGELKLDWDFIDAAVAAQWKEYEESMQKMEDEGGPVEVDWDLLDFSESIH